MRRIYVLAVVLGLAGMNGWARTYTTSFPLTESPISEGGNWVNATAGGGYVSTTPGLAIGHSGPDRYQDATALLTGTWGPDQTAQATVYAGTVFNAPEVEVHLRATATSGYEISHSVVNGGNGSYLIVVTYGGGGFTILSNLSGSQYSVKTGDVVKATVAGNVITVYKNGVQEAQVTDNSWTTGNPGIGFNELTNGDYGITSFTATDGVTSTQNPCSIARAGQQPAIKCLTPSHATYGGLYLEVPFAGEKSRQTSTRIFDLSGHEVNPMSISLHSQR